MVTKLCVLYDASCGFCVRCRWWMAMQPVYVELDFVPAGSPEAARRFPTLPEAYNGEDLTVIDDEGGVYRGPDAFIMCLYALQEYRELASELAIPALKPFAKAAFELVSTSRKWLSKLLGLKNEQEMAELVESTGTHVQANPGAPARRDES